MKKLVSFLRGVVQMEGEGRFPERLLNLMAQQRLDFWAVEWEDPHRVRFLTHRCFVGSIRTLEERSGCRVRAESGRGLPEVLLRFRARGSFLAGLALCLLAVGLLSRFVWTVEVTGNVRTPEAVILSELSRLGLRPGVYGPALDRRQIAQDAVTRLEGVAWMGINRFGTRIEVTVREAVPAPEPLDETEYWDIVAETGGIVVRVEPEQGDAAVGPGDTVAEGDLLIAGKVTMEPPRYSDLPFRYYETHARGRVWARTWRTVTAVIPAEARVKTYTGEEKRVWSLIWRGKRIEIFGNSSISWPSCDKITTVHWNRLPIRLLEDTIRPYEVSGAEVRPEGAQALLEQRLESYLRMLTGEQGQICGIRYQCRTEGKLLRVTARAECLEEIGRAVPGGGRAIEPEKAP